MHASRRVSCGAVDKKLNGRHHVLSYCARGLFLLFGRRQKASEVLLVQVPCCIMWNRFTQWFYLTRYHDIILVIGRHIPVNDEAEKTQVVSLRADGEARGLMLVTHHSFEQLHINMLHARSHNAKQHKNAQCILLNEQQHQNQGPCNRFTTTGVRSSRLHDSTDEPRTSWNVYSVKSARSVSSMSRAVASTARVSRMTISVTCL